MIPLYQSFVETLEEQFDVLQKMGSIVESQKVDLDERSARFRVENQTHIGEILIWEHTLTFQQSVASLYGDSFLLEADGCPIPSEPAEEALSEFFGYFK